MPIIPIQSIDDPRILLYRELPKSQPVRESGTFIAEGDKVTERLLQSRFAVHSLLVEERFLDVWQAQAAPETPIYVVSRDMMSATVGFRFHRGVMGCGIRAPEPELADFIPPAPQSCLLAVFPETHDPTNLGTMIRTCAALGVSGILLGPGGADPFSRRVVRVSMGAIFSIAVRTSHDLLGDLQRLRNEFQIELWSAVLDERAKSLSNCRPAARCGLLIGSEGHGLSSEIASAGEHLVTIPMPEAIDSLNAAVATGIFLYRFANRESISHPTES